MNADDAPAVRFPPPLVFIGFALLGPLVDRLFGIARLPLPWPVGAVIAVAGVAFAATAMGLFRRRGENPTPWTPTLAIIDTGLYAHTRNPMYLGMTVAQAGIALAFGSIAGLALVAVTIAVIQFGVIVPEESYLTRTFGTAYTGYRSRVRRWL